MNDNVHSGHRERLKKRFIDNGFDNMEDHEILELLLFYAIPRKDTNELSHRLIDHFGSISSVFDASISSLIEVKGVSNNTAILIKMIPGISSVYEYNKHQTDKPVNIDMICKLLLKKYIGIDNEVIYLTLLDVKCKLIFMGILNEGSINCAPVYVKKLITLATQYNAFYAVVSHNHPSGNALPTRSDVNTTKLIKDALNIIDVKLIDHIIIADGEAVSLAQSGIYPEIFDFRRR